MTQSVNQAALFQPGPFGQEEPAFDLEKGRTLKVEGQATTEASNERFVDLMREEALRIIASDGYVTCDDLRRYALKLGIEPHHPNAWGAIFRGKGWKLVDRTLSQFTTNHARSIGIWTWVEPDQG